MYKIAHSDHFTLDHVPFGFGAPKPPLADGGNGDIEGMPLKSDLRFQPLLQGCH